MSFATLSLTKYRRISPKFFPFNKTQPLPATGIIDHARSEIHNIYQADRVAACGGLERKAPSLVAEILDRNPPWTSEFKRITCQSNLEWDDYKVLDAPSMNNFSYQHYQRHELKGGQIG